VDFSLDAILGEDAPNDYEIWDDQPGGEIVDEWEEDGVTYVNVVSKNSPNEKYTYIKE
jgi:hypothetical protein